jgi:hypothetical protein
MSVSVGVEAFDSIFIHVKENLIVEYSLVFAILYILD